MAYVADAVAAMESGDQPPIAELILADARAIYWPKTMTGRDHQRAVLLAAVASEIRQKNGCSRSPTREPHRSSR